MKKIFNIVATLIILGYLLIGRGHWFSGFERQIEIGSKPYLSDVVDISKPHTFTWKITKGAWSYEEGEARVSIVFQRVDDIPSKKYNKEQMSLRVKIDAYGITNDTGPIMTKAGIKTNRLIKNWYYTTDEPLSSEAKLWESWGKQEIEHGLGAVNLYPFEDLFIEITVLKPDQELAKTEPKLKIVGKHDYAVFGIIFICRLIRDGGLILCVLLLLFINIFSWRAKKNGA